MLIVLLGPPAAGKGTQAKKICNSLSIPHISTGSILRQNISEKTPLGEVASLYINKGDLVPDEVIIAVVKDRLRQPDCAKGALLDGFPRTLRQAEELDELIQVDKVIDIEVSRQILTERVTGRRVCKNCGTNYHISVYTESNCNCGGSLQTREDDTEAALAVRLNNYDKQTLPLRQYYAGDNRLIQVSGIGTPAEVFERIKEALA